MTKGGKDGSKTNRHGNGNGNGNNSDQNTAPPQAGSPNGNGNGDVLTPHHRSQSRPAIATAASNGTVGGGEIRLSPTNGDHGGKLHHQQSHQLQHGTSIGFRMNHPHTPLASVASGGNNNSNEGNNSNVGAQTPPSGQFQNWITSPTTPGHTKALAQ
jgi:hypothetical protein